MLAQRRGCVIRGPHGALHQNVGTRSNYIFQLSGKTIKKSNNPKIYHLTGKTGHKSSDILISTSVKDIFFIFQMKGILGTDPFFMVVQTPSGFIRK